MLERGPRKGLAPAKNFLSRALDKAMLGWVVAGIEVVMVCMWDKAKEVSCMSRDAVQVRNQPELVLNLVTSYLVTCYHVAILCCTVNDAMCSFTFFWGNTIM